MKKSPFVLLAALAAATLVCTRSTVPDDWSEFTKETVEGCLTELARAEERYLDALDEEGIDAACRAAVDYLMIQPCTDTAGVSPDSSVWVFFENGMLGTILETTFDTTGAARQAAAPRPDVEVCRGGEASPIAVALEPFGLELPSRAFEEVVRLVDTCYGRTADPMAAYYVSEVTVDRVLGELAAGPGVLYWSGHGQLLPPERGAEPCCGLLTAESYATRDMAEKVVERYPAKILPGPVGRELAVTIHNRKYYLVILPAFVAIHADFDQLEGHQTNYKKSIVYLSTCYSAYQQNPALEQAFLDAGADVFCGYDWVVGLNFSDQIDIAFFTALSDTCTAAEALGSVGTRTEPKSRKGRNATFRFSGDSLYMIRAQLNGSKDDEDFHAYHVLATMSGVPAVTGFAGEQGDIGFTVQFPGSGTHVLGVTEDAGVMWYDLSTMKRYVAAENCVGISGTIQVARFDPDILSGTFSGTLGWWAPGHNSNEVPPDETIQILDGFFKHTGPRQ